jgi:hypothetical protein
MMEGVNSTMISYKNFCKCHDVLQYNNNTKIKNKFKNKTKQKTVIVEKLMEIFGGPRAFR